MTTPPPSLDAVLPILIATFLTACAAQLTRQLMKDTPPRARRTLAASVGAGLAGLSTSSLLLEWTDVGALALIAVSSIVGWNGAPVLGLLGATVERRLGLRLAPEREERRH